jgi:hypothetical protein
MLNVLGPRSWIFWWAGLTAMAFLQDILHQVAEFFRNNAIFSRNIPPFSLVPNMNGWIDTIANSIQTNIQFDPAKPLATLGPLAIPNWTIAVLVGVLILAGALLVYRRALGTSALLDDFLALFLLYFVIRIEGHLFAIANILGSSKTIQAALNNQYFSFGIVLLFLIGLAVTGEGLHSARSFWRALIELLLVGVLIFPTEAGMWVANGIDAFAGFGRLLQQGPYSVAWGLIGLFLALRRLYYVDAKA